MIALKKIHESLPSGSEDLVATLLCNNFQEIQNNMIKIHLHQRY